MCTPCEGAACAPCEGAVFSPCEGAMCAHCERAVFAPCECALVRGPCTGGVEQVEQEGALVVVLHPHHLLRDVLARAADATHRQEDVVVQEVLCQDLRDDRDSEESSHRLSVRNNVQ